jgi:hypothetical protein
MTGDGPYNQPRPRTMLKPDATKENAQNITCGFRPQYDRQREHG